MEEDDIEDEDDEDGDEEDGDDGGPVYSVNVSSHSNLR